MYVALHGEPVRVLFSTPYATASASGVGAVVRALCSMNRADGQEPIVVEPVDGRSPRGLANVRLALRTARTMVARRAEFDVAHCQQLHPQSLFVGLAGHVLGKSVVLTVHGRSPRPMGLRGALFDFVEQSCLRLADRVVFVARSLREEFGGRGSVLPNGVDVAAIRARGHTRDAVRRELEAGDAVLILYVGRVTEDKGIFVLLDAFEMAGRLTKRPLRLVIVGPVDDEVANRQTALQGEKIRLLGFSSDAVRFLPAADLFVLPSLREGLPLSLLEAMAAGVPVVATSVGDVPHLLRGGELGALVMPGDAQALARAIAHVADDSKRALAMGLEAQREVERDHDVRGMRSGYRAIYAELAREHI